jgi:hypothetical protein
LFDPSKIKPEMLVRMILEREGGATYGRKVLGLLTQRLEEAAAKTRERAIANLNKGRKSKAAREIKPKAAAPN